jgi:hypothetical protein
MGVNSFVVAAIADDLGVVDDAVGVTVALFCPQAAGAGAATGAAATDAGTAAAPFAFDAGAAAPCGPQAVVTGAGRQAEPEKVAGTVGVTEPFVVPSTVPFAVTATTSPFAVVVVVTTVPGARGGKATCAGSPKGVSLSSPG